MQGLPIPRGAEFAHFNLWPFSCPQKVLDFVVSFKSSVWNIHMYHHTYIIELQLNDNFDTINFAPQRGIYLHYCLSLSAMVHSLTSLFRSNSESVCLIGTSSLLGAI